MTEVCVRDVVVFTTEGFTVVESKFVRLDGEVYSLAADPDGNEFWLRFPGFRWPENGGH